jgi:hypothetical protein
LEQIQSDAKKNYSEAFDKVDRHRGYNTFWAPHGNVQLANPPGFPPMRLFVGFINAKDHPRDGEDVFAYLRSDSAVFYYGENDEKLSFGLATKIRFVEPFSVVYTDDTDDKEEGAKLLRGLIAWYYVRRDIIPYFTVEGDVNIARLQVCFEKIAAHLTENEHKAAEDARKREEENNTFRDFAKRMLKEAETKDPVLALRVKEIADLVADDHGVGRFLQIETE